MEYSMGNDGGGAAAARILFWIGFCGEADKRQRYRRFLLFQVYGHLRRGASPFLPDVINKYKKA